ncbi:MAG: hypothetical protein Q7Q71_13620 [Verrucomicrobiota bacterium JB023]|nr:hypothetical protein [Verrucomicrobiota bacterium JB023]
MKNSLVVRALSALLIFSFWQGALAVPDQVVSADGRVIVTGSDPRVRGAVLSTLTDLRSELRTVLGEMDVTETGEPARYEMRHNLLVSLVGRPGDQAPQTRYTHRVREVEGLEGYRIEMFIHLSRGLDRREVRKEVLERLLLEIGLREQLDEGQTLKVPAWLVAGVSERLAWRNGEADRGLYRALYESGHVLDLEELLEATDEAEMDAAARTAFRVSSGALVRAMLNQPQGEASFGRLLRDAATFEGEALALVRRHFPETGLSDESLAKWWALQLANLTQDFVSDTLGILETEDALRKVLRGTLDDENGKPVSYRVEEFHRIIALEKEQRALLLRPINEKLGLLAFRCFPSYRPMIEEYRKVLGDLLEGREEKMVARLTILREEREIFIEVGSQTEDYLDWFTINTASEISGDFEDYLRLKAQLESSRPESQSPIEAYLDVMQQLYNE